jgi:hypothetical protein
MAEVDKKPNPVLAKLARLLVSMVLGLPLTAVMSAALTHLGFLAWDSRALLQSPEKAVSLWLGMSVLPYIWLSVLSRRVENSSSRQR